MTMGQLMFGGGAALLVIAIVLAIIFARKRPRYEPEGVMQEVRQDSSQRLRNAYPTEEVAVQETELLDDATSATEILPAETEYLPEDQKGNGTSLLLK